RKTPPMRNTDPSGQSRAPCGDDAWLSCWQLIILRCAPVIPGPPKAPSNYRGRQSRSVLGSNPAILDRRSRKRHEEQLRELRRQRQLRESNSFPYPQPVLRFSPKQAALLYLSRFAATLLLRPGRTVCPRIREGQRLKPTLSTRGPVSSHQSIYIRYTRQSFL